jgi:nucleoside-diphosphate-sugar epimerase
MRHLITGGSGFLGNLIARRLFERGEKIRVLDIWEDESRPKDIEYVECDIRDRMGVAKAMEGIEIVHHNAALVPLTKSGRNFWEVNVEGSRIVAEEAVRAGVKGFIHMSSSALFGVPEKTPIPPEASPHPVEIYGHAKLAGEKAIREVLEGTGMPLIVIRPRTILGEGRLGIFQIVFEWISQGKNVYVIGNGDVRFQFLHVHDLMDFYLLALQKGKSGIYNVGTNRFGTLREVLENLIAYAGTESKVKSLPAWLTINMLRVLDCIHLCPLAPWHYLTYHKAFCFDVQPLLEMGWKPKYSNDEMFQESYDWFLENYAHFQAEKGMSPHRRPVKGMVLRVVKWVS